MVVDIIISRDNNAKISNGNNDNDNDNNNDNDIYSGEEEEDGRFQEAAERLAVEAYVRGSTDNIGVCVVAVD